MTAELDTTSDDSAGILPARMSAGARWDADTAGPRALMLAVLEDALPCNATLEIATLDAGHRGRIGDGATSAGATSALHSQSVRFGLTAPAAAA